jgi:CRP/FNR family transcriptional regulator, cyclic AMP receptor protein
VTQCCQMAALRVIRLQLSTAEWLITLIDMEEPLWRTSPPLHTDEELCELEEIGHRIHRSAGHPFFLEGEQGDFALLIKKGYVKVLSGSPPRIVDVRGPGAIIGEMAVLGGKPRTASVVAFDDVEALYLPGVRWLPFLYDHPRTMHALIVMADDMADRAVTKSVESELAVERQLAKRIVELIDMGLGEHISDGSVVLRVSQHDLASLIGAKKLDSVKKVIKQLKASEIVGTGRQVISILRPDRLRQIADGDYTVS